MEKRLLKRVFSCFVVVHARNGLKCVLFESTPHGRCSGVHKGRQLDTHARSIVIFGRCAGCRVQFAVWRVHVAVCTVHVAVPIAHNLQFRSRTICSSDRCQNAVAIVVLLCRTTAETTNVGAASARVASARRTCVQDRVCAPLRALRWHLQSQHFAFPMGGTCILQFALCISNLAVCISERCIFISERHFRAALPFREMRFRARILQVRALAVVSMLHVRLCGKPRYSTRVEQSLLYAFLLPLRIERGLRPRQFPREAGRHIIGSVPHLLSNMVFTRACHGTYLLFHA